MDLFRCEWHLMEICRELRVFSGPHDDSVDIVHGWENLNEYLPVEQNWADLR